MDAAALPQLAQVLDRAGEDTRAGQQYVTGIETLGVGEGLINQMAGGHQDAYRALTDWLARLSDPTLSQVSQAINEASAYYQRTDRDAAEHLDRTYPETYVGEVRENAGYVPIEPPASTGLFQDVCEPQQHLVQTKDYLAEMDASLDWWDTFSPMAVVGEALEIVSELGVILDLLPHKIDPQAEIVKPWVGDWAAVRAAADVLRNLGHELNDIATNIKWASQGSETIWQGNAGDGAAVYLMNLTVPLEAAWRPLDELAHEYQNASQEMVALRDAVVAVLNAIGDAAIEAALAAAVTGTAASTGVGVPLAVIAGLFGSYKIYRVVDGIKEIFGLVAKMDTIVKGVKAAQTRYGTVQSGISLPVLPQSTLPAPK